MGLPYAKRGYQMLAYIGAALTLIWGVSHLFPTRGVVKGFGGISEDNRRIITMEWITEGVALIFMGVLVGLVTWIDPASPAAHVVYLLTALGLLALAVVSLFTGFRVNFLPYRLCPFIFTVSAILIGAGAVI